MRIPKRPIKHLDKPCPVCGGDGTLQYVDPDELRTRRKRSGMGLRELARKIGFTPAYLHDIETGRRNCTAQIEKEYSKL